MNDKGCKVIFGALLTVVGLVFSAFSFIYAAQNPWNWNGIDGLLGSFLGTHMLVPSRNLFCGRILRRRLIRLPDAGFTIRKLQGSLGAGCPFLFQGQPDERRVPALLKSVRQQIFPHMTDAFPERIAFGEVRK